MSLAVRGNTQFPPVPRPCKFLVIGQLSCWLVLGLQQVLRCTQEHLRKQTEARWLREVWLFAVHWVLVSFFPTASIERQREETKVTPA